MHIFWKLTAAGSVAEMFVVVVRLLDAEEELAFGYSERYVELLQCYY